VPVEDTQQPGGGFGVLEDPTGNGGAVRAAWGLLQRLVVGGMEDGEEFLDLGATQTDGGGGDGEAMLLVLGEDDRVLELAAEVGELFGSAGVLLAEPLVVSEELLAAGTGKVWLSEEELDAVSVVVESLA
jgi:hypothetical protein